MALKHFKTFPLLEEQLNCLTVIKGQSPNTVVEYRTDFLMFLSNLKGKRARKIVSIRQFWKYLKTKAKVIENIVSEELETPKIPQTNA